MSADEMPRAAVPHERLHEVKLVQRACELLEAGVTRLQGATRVVRGRKELRDGKSLNVHRQEGG